MASLPGDREISGSDKTLAACIRDGTVGKPPLMQHNEWLQWRRDIGMRPRKAVDGATTTSAQEARLWRETMSTLYGPEWIENLNAGPEELPDPAPSSSAAAGPTGAPAAALPGMPPPPPGPGEATGGIPLQAGSTSSASAGEPQRLLNPEDAPLPATPAAGGIPFAKAPSPIAASLPGTPGGLGRRMAADFDPRTQNLTEYNTRLVEAAQKLEALGYGPPPRELEEKMARAAILAEVHQEVYAGVTVAPGATLESSRAAAEVESLRGLLGSWLLESQTRPSEEAGTHVNAIAKLLAERGVDTTEVRNAMLAGGRVTPTPTEQGAAVSTPTRLQAAVPVYKTPSPQAEPGTGSPLLAESPAAAGMAAASHVLLWIVVDKQL